jgi:phosphatidylinositol 4-kinase type 2
MVSMNPKVDPGFRSPDLKVFVRDVRDTQGKKRPVIVRSWATVKDLKDVVQQLLDIHAGSQRLYYGPLLTSGKELPNYRSLHDVGIDRSGVTVLLDIKERSGGIEDSSSRRSNQYANDIIISSSMFDATPRLLRSIVQQARRGLAVGFKPDLALEGSGGTYFLHDSRKNKIAVFKPADEEPYADNNPRGYIRVQDGDSLRKGIRPGEACIREVAAYLLDHDGFAGVPMTTFVEARHPAFNTNGSRLNVSQGGASIGSHSLTPSKTGSDVVSCKLEDKYMKKAGSLQEFVRFECTIDDISPSKLSVDEVHKIAILDIRLMNADRNAANLIVRKMSDKSLQLVPIDHGYCLRSVCDVSWMDWCWLDWPQLKMVRRKKLIRVLTAILLTQLFDPRLSLLAQNIASLWQTLTLNQMHKCCVIG